MSGKRMFHRLRQFCDALFYRPQPDQYKAAENLLSPRLYQLFLSLPPAEQAHGLHVYSLLIAQGHTDTYLLTAAILHDAGKSRYPLRVWERIWVVLAQHYLPRLAERWSDGKPAGLKKALVLSARHAEWGAQLAAEYGADPLVIDLIQRHQDKAPFSSNGTADQLLALLQAVDNQI